MSTSGGSSGGAGAVHVANIISSAGNISWTNTNAPTLTAIGSLTGGTGASQFDLQITASTGDLVLLCPAFLCQVSGVATFDFETVTGSHWASTGTGTAAGNGVAAWLADLEPFSLVGAPVLYTVQSSDLSGGKVTFRPMAAATSGSTITMECSSTNTVAFTAINITALALGT